MADAIMHEVDGDEYDVDNDGIASEDGDDPVIAEAPPVGSGAARAMEEHRNDFEGADSDSDSEPEAESEADDERERYAADNGPCSVQCLERALEQERRMEAMKDQHAAEVERLNEQIRELERELERLRLENEELRARKPRQTKKTWPEFLEKLFAMGNGDNKWAYYEKFVYPVACREENMSPVKYNIHPNLNLRKYTPEEKRRETDRARRHEEEVRYRWLREDLDGLILDAVASVEDDEELFVPMASPEPPAIERLPKEIQARIITHLFDFRGKLVHCLSRMDPFAVPSKVEAMDGPGKLPKRFHIGNKECSITAAKRPEELLHYFKVNKFWYFIGVHAFYGMNTFAFSSLGEFGRFMGGIGPARRQRIQNVEMLWIGSQKVCFPVKKGKYASRRTWFAHWLLDMPRLRSLVIHIHETKAEHMRRGHEPIWAQNFMAKKSQRQPNYRRTRSLRTVQGFDFIYALRGMQNVLFYDFTRRIELGAGRHFVRDWGFYMDIEHQVKMPKSPENQRNAALKNLATLLPEGLRNSDFLNYVKHIYANSPLGAFDNGEDISGNLALPAPDPPSDDSDSSSDSDDDDDTPRPERRRPRGPRSDRVIPIESDDDSDDDSNDDSDDDSDGEQAAHFDGVNSPRSRHGFQRRGISSAQAIEIESDTENDSDDSDVEEPHRPERQPRQHGSSVDRAIEIESDSDDNSDGDGESDMDSKSEPDMDSKTEGDVDSKTEPNVDFKSELNDDSKAEPDSDSESEPDMDSKTELDDNLKPEPDVESKSEPDFDSKSNIDSKSEPDIESDNEGLARGLEDLGIGGGDTPPGSREGSQDPDMDDIQEIEEVNQSDTALGSPSSSDDEDEPEFLGSQQQADVVDLTQDDEEHEDEDTTGEHEREPSREPAPSPSVPQLQRQHSEATASPPGSPIYADALPTRASRSTEESERLFVSQSPSRTSPPFHRAVSPITNRRTNSREPSGGPAADMQLSALFGAPDGRPSPVDEDERRTQEARSRTATTNVPFWAQQSILASKRKSPDSDDNATFGRPSKQGRKT